MVIFDGLENGKNQKYHGLEIENIQNTH